MEKKDIDALRDRVSCGAVLEHAGWAVDVKESSRRAVKYRRDAEIVIVNHEGKGWFDPLSDAKGDVFSLPQHLDGISFPVALERVRSLIGFTPDEPVWRRPARSPARAISIGERWSARRVPRSGSPSWRYLAEVRGIPASILQAACDLGVLREGPHGSMWAAHSNAAGQIIGWEERGQDWRGFSTGGTKDLFRLGPPHVLRICITEAAIDAMSLAALEEPPEPTLYVSTGGGWSPATVDALAILASQPDAVLVAATDANSQGETYARRLRAIAAEAGCGVERLMPEAEDWNEQLRLARGGKA